MADNNEKALNLLIETYKLYAAFCAIIIAGLLSFSSSLECANVVYLLYIAIGSLSLGSILCILGVQNFISQTYRNDFNIYNKTAKIITFFIMALLIIGLVTGFLFLINQDKLKRQEVKQEFLRETKVEQNCIQDQVKDTNILIFDIPKSK